MVLVFFLFLAGVPLIALGTMTRAQLRDGARTSRHNLALTQVIAGLVSRQAEIEGLEIKTFTLADGSQGRLVSARQGDQEVSGVSVETGQGTRDIRISYLYSKADGPTLGRELTEAWEQALSNGSAVSGLEPLLRLQRVQTSVPGISTKDSEKLSRWLDVANRFWLGS